MKRWGIITLMLFAFIVGFASTYSCNGGSSATAGGDADTLEGHPAAYFAVSGHSHPGYATTALLSSHTHSEYALSTHMHNMNDINFGVLDTTYFSAYTDLQNEGYLDNDSNNDLLTRTQLDSRYSPSIHPHPISDISGTIDADLLEGMGANQFAPSGHSHNETLTGYYSVSPSAFTPFNSSQFFQIDNIGVNGTDAFFFAPVSLPHNCIVKSFSVSGFENSSLVVTARLLRTDHLTNEFEMAYVDSSAFAGDGASDFWTSTDSSIQSSQVDNISYTYAVELFIASGNESYLGGYIEYDYTLN